MNINEVNKYFDNNKEEFYKLHQKRILVISDIHGCYKEFIKLLEKVNYNSTQDQLILLGDYTDRGIDSKKVIDKVIELHKDGATVLQGNHDKMFTEAIRYDVDAYNSLWLNNGGMMTVGNYIGDSFFEEGFNWDDYDKVKEYIRKNYSHHIHFLESLPLYHETDQFVFVHAGINPYINNMKNQIEDDLLWIRDRFLHTKLETNKTVIFGHTPTPYLNKDGSSDIWFSGHEDKIGVDGGCCFGYRLNCLIIENGEYKMDYVERGEG